MRDRNVPWLWIALAGVGVVALVIVLVAVAAGGDDADTAAETGDAATTTVAVDDEAAATETQRETTTETETVPVETGTDAEPTSVVVPDVAGMNFVAAGRRADDAHLIADSYPVESDAEAGRVVSQDPAPGREVAPTRRLRLNVSVGPGARETLRVPDVTGPKAPRARQIAWEHGFTTLTADRDAPSAEEVDEVILQEPAAGTSAPAFTQITLYVGR